jgi:heme-degrading monooxygenase HmoA
MISRHWTGIAKRERASEYIAHLQNDTLKKLKQINGFVRASILKRDTAEGVEFLVTTDWLDKEAIKKFAGENYEQAVVPDIAQQMLVRFDRTVRHYEVVA